MASINNMKAVPSKKGIHVIKVTIATVEKSSFISFFLKYFIDGKNTGVAFSLNNASPRCGGMDKVMASIPRTVLVPVANKLVKNTLSSANESRVGVIWSLLPKAPRYFALKLSTQIKMTLGRMAD